MTTIDVWCAVDHAITATSRWRWALVGLLTVTCLGCGADPAVPAALDAGIAAGDAANDAILYAWPDATQHDGGPVDATIADAQQADATHFDTDAADALLADAGQLDAPDTTTPDTTTPDTTTPDTTAKDVHPSFKDASILSDVTFTKDAGLKDAGLKDAGYKDALPLFEVTFTKDTGVKDAGSKDAGSKDAGASDTSTTVPSTVPGPLFPYTNYNPKLLEGWKTKPPACAPGDLMGRYFRYRLRMRGPGDGSTGGFVGIGKGAGRSLLAGTRDPSSTCSKDWWVNDAKCKYADGNAKGRYVFGDTTIWQGYYLTFLATEYAAFAKLGVDLTQTRSDLYHALTAFNRLDADAETHFGKPGKVDGFFVRSDVPASLMKTSTGQWRFPHSGTAGGYGCVQGGSDCKGVSIKDGYFESQDQAVGMAMGLAMVWKLVPKGTMFAGMDLHQESRATLHRIVSFLRNNKWKVKAPDGTVPPAAWGGSAVAFSSELAKAANRVCGKDFGVNDYRDLTTKTQGATIFAALGTSWALQTDVNRALGAQSAAVSGTWSQALFEKRVAAWGSPYFSLIYAVLRGEKWVGDGSLIWQVQSHLDKAPCGGPCNVLKGCTEGLRWRGENILARPQYRGGYRNVLSGEYTGIDYLILHNLLVIMQAGKTHLALDKATSQGKVCFSVTTLPKVLAGGLTSGTVNVKDPCHAATLSQRYCGRSFGAWLEDASLGKATIFTGKARWNCKSTGICTLSAHSGKGTAGTDLYVGGAGADSFHAGGGADCLVGGGGDDLLEGGQGRDELWGGGGNDKLYGESQGIVLTGDGDLLVGGDGDDVLKGGPGRDDLYGDAGNDSLDGGNEDDFLYGGVGNDTLLCGAGSDLAMGEAGDDSIKGEAGVDALYGGDGRDKLDGGSGDDALMGGEGDDFLDGGSGDDILWGENGDDHLCGGAGKDDLNGGWSSKDGCRAKGFLDFSSDKETGCGFKLKSSQCTSKAFKSW